MTHQPMYGIWIESRDGEPLRHLMQGRGPGTVELFTDAGLAEDDAAAMCSDGFDCFVVPVDIILDEIFVQMRGVYQ